MIERGDGDNPKGFSLPSTGPPYESLKLCVFTFIYLKQTSQKSIKILTNRDLFDILKTGGLCPSKLERG
jgi:hypothetical protein